MQLHIHEHPTGQLRAPRNSDFVQLKDVTLRYGGEEDGVLALAGANIEVAKGEFLAVVGPSGCGKSTLMKAISGLWPVTSGAVFVDGSRVEGPLSCIGMAFQNPTPLPWRTTLDNVMLPLEIVEPHRSRLRQQRSEYEAKARALLDLVGLSEFDRHYPWQLSGGMQQRASICRALIHEPSLLMLDEPFGALDMFTREELWVTLQDIWLARRPTIILVTHDIREAVYLADRVLVMSARPGRVIAECHVPFERTRSLDITFQPEFGELVHELREHISMARAKPATKTGDQK